MAKLKIAATEERSQELPQEAATPKETPPKQTPQQQTARVIAPVPAPGDRNRPPAGKTFRDCADCPEMVLLAGGTFAMGSRFGPAEEKPPREIMVPAGLAVGRFELTKTQWTTCVVAGDCKNVDAAAQGQPNHPVTDISWHDAKIYVRWLARRTGKPYRLLSEPEWEYAHAFRPFRCCSLPGSRGRVFDHRHEYPLPGPVRTRRQIADDCWTIGTCRTNPTLPGPLFARCR